MKNVTVVEKYRAALYKFIDSLLECIESWFGSFSEDEVLLAVGDV